MARQRTFIPLKLGITGTDWLPPSIPLILPDDCEYDPRRNQLRPRDGVTRRKLEVVPDALALLEGIKKPVAVLSICGPYRTGKSYILSRLLGSSDAFALGHTMDAKTVGIWMGTTALECDEFVLILLDTEGIDAVSAMMTDDASIFVMTILLSSYLIYNSLNIPQKSDLERMSCFTKLPKGIVVRKGRSNTVTSFHQHFPNFLWLLRDFNLVPVDEHGNEIPPFKYLTEHILRMSDSFDETSVDKVKKAIVVFFPSVDCKFLPTPSVDPDVMRAIEINEHKLNPAFRQGVAELVHYLFANVSVKRGFQKSSKVDGPMLVHLTKQYVEAVNDPDSIPHLENVWETVIKLQREVVLSKLTKEYENDLEAHIKEASNGCPLEEDSADAAQQDSTLMGIHRRVLVAKVRTLMNEMSHLLPNDDADKGLDSERLIAELENRIVQYKTETIKDVAGVYHERKIVTGGVLHKYVRRNHDESEMYCRGKFEELYTPIAYNVVSSPESYTFKSLIEDLAQLYDKYSKVARGPAKWDVFSFKMKEVEKEKELFKKLKGFQADMFRKTQGAAQLEAQNTLIQAKLDKVHQQGEAEKKRQEKIIKLMQKQFEERKAEMKKNEDERRRTEELQIQKLKNANMEQMAKSAAENSKVLADAFTGMFQMVQVSREQQNKTMTELFKTLINKPPAPAPHPPPVMTEPHPMAKQWPTEQPSGPPPSVGETDGSGEGGLLSQRVTDRPDCLILFRTFVSRNAARKGRAVLEGVGLDSSAIEACFQSNPLNDEEAVQAGLIKWKGGSCQVFPCTWGVLIGAMEYARVDQQYIAGLKTKLGLP